jgi:hypothetical protein
MFCWLTASQVNVGSGDVARRRRGDGHAIGNALRLHGTAERCAQLGNLVQIDRQKHRLAAAQLDPIHQHVTASVVEIGDDRFGAVARRRL